MQTSSGNMTKQQYCLIDEIITELGSMSFFHHENASESSTKAETEYMLQQETFCLHLTFNFTDCSSLLFGPTIISKSPGSQTYCNS